MINTMIIVTALLLVMRLYTFGGEVQTAGKRCAPCQDSAYFTFIETEALSTSPSIVGIVIRRNDSLYVVDGEVEALIRSLDKAYSTNGYQRGFDAIMDTIQNSLLTAEPIQVPSDYIARHLRIHTLAVIKSHPSSTMPLETLLAGSFSDDHFCIDHKLIPIEVSVIVWRMSQARIPLILHHQLGCYKYRLRGCAG